jgi:hypothetical protein
MRVPMLTLTSFLLIATAQAQPGPDDVVSRAGYDAANAERFERLDANGDGVLTRDELRQARGARRDEFRNQVAEHMAEIDTDGDGAWSLPELQSARQRATQEQFTRMDRDGNGLITADEQPSAGGRRGPGRRAF